MLLLLIAGLFLFVTVFLNCSNVITVSVCHYFKSALIPYQMCWQFVTCSYVLIWDTLMHICMQALLAPSLTHSLTHWLTHSLTD